MEDSSGTISNRIVLRLNHSHSQKIFGSMSELRGRRAPQGREGYTRDRRFLDPFSYRPYENIPHVELTEIDKLRFRYIAILDDYKSTSHLHIDYGICSSYLRRDKYQNSLPHIERGNDVDGYQTYPFVVVKKKNNQSEKAQFEVFIYSERLLCMIVKALGLRGGLDMYTCMRQNGLQILRAWQDLRLYLDKRRDTDKITKQTTVFRQEIAELELLVYGFLENWDILSAVGVGTLLEQGWITSRYYDAINERMSVHRKLDHLADGFHRAGDEAELYLDKYWLNKMNVKREMLKRFYNAYSSIWSFLSESYESLRFYCRIKHTRDSMRQHHLQSKTDQEIAHRTRYLVGMTLHSKAEIEKDYYLERIVCLAIEGKLGDLSIAVGCFREAIAMEHNIKMRIHQLEEEQSRQENIKHLHRRFKLEYDIISQYIQNTQITQATEPCQRFKARFPRYQDFWDKGIQTIHWVLEGNPPGTFVQALSSISVSTAMAFVLDEVGETCRMRGEVIADIGIWGKEIRSTSERLFFEQICKDIWVRNSADEGFDYDYSESGYTPQYLDSLKDLAKYLVTHSRGLYQPPSVLKKNLCLNDDSPGFQNSSQGPSIQCLISPNEIPLGEILQNISIPIAGELEISPPIEFMPENIIYMPYADIPFAIPPFQPTLSVTETNAALDLCLNIMASAVFTAIILFLHFMSRGPRRFQDIVQNGLFNPLIGDNRFDCFKGVFHAALAKVKSGCLTGFYNVVDFIRLNAHFSFPDRLYDQKLFCLQETTKDLLLNVFIMWSTQISDLNVRNVRLTAPRWRWNHTIASLMRPPMRRNHKPHWSTTPKVFIQALALIQRPI